MRLNIPTPSTPSIPQPRSRRRPRRQPRRAFRRPKPVHDLAALLAGWHHLPADQLADRILQIQRLAADPAHPRHLSEHVWRAVDRMRDTLKIYQKMEV
jgi:hypothetical protein